MHHFQYKRGELHCEAVPLARIAEEVGTPAYIYSYATLERHFRVFDEAFAGIPHLICFAMKANSNLAVIRAIARWGGGIDIVSGGELFRARTAGVPADRIVYSGVGKTYREIAYALKEGILLFNVESAEELKTLAEEAGKQGCAAPVAIRVNPDIDPRTHPYISTGLKKSKFGVQIKEALSLYDAARGDRRLQVRGVSFHIGSQITRLKPFVEALRRVADLVEELRGRGSAIDMVDLGGGLGIPYREETPPSPEAYGRALKDVLARLKLRVLFEPGRVIVGNAGILLVRALLQKSQGKKRFLVVDGGMNDLIRPALYGSYHEILPVRQKRGKKHRVDLVGPVCESGDFFAENRPLPVIDPPGLVAVMSAGAYGFVMSSNYNSRPRAPEVLVRGNEFFVVRRREEYKDLLKGEHVPKFLT